MPETLKDAVMGDWLTKLLLAVISALIIWLGSTVQDLTISTAVQAAVQTEAVAGLKADLAQYSLDRYTGSQAKADQALIEQRLSRLEDWSATLSARLSDLEDDTRDLFKIFEEAQ